MVWISTILISEFCSSMYTFLMIILCIPPIFKNDDTQIYMAAVITDWFDKHSSTLLYVSLVSKYGFPFNITEYLWTRWKENKTTATKEFPSYSWARGQLNMTHIQKLKESLLRWLEINYSTSKTLYCIKMMSTRCGD